MKKIIKKIVDKKFESVINGYSPSSVDSFLDSIIKDIEEKEREVNNLKNEIIVLNEENNLLKSKISKLESCKQNQGNEKNTKTEMDYKNIPLEEFTFDEDE